MENIFVEFVYKIYWRYICYIFILEYDDFLIDVDGMVLFIFGNFVFFLIFIMCNMNDLGYCVECKWNKSFLGEIVLEVVCFVFIFKGLYIDLCNCKNWFWIE